jgi:hypothetical protein
MSSDDSAFLGDLKPGEKGTARYEVSVNSAAIPKEYALDSEVRYRDTLDNSLVSDTLRVRVTVPAGSGPENLLTNPFIPLGIAALLGAGYYVLAVRKMEMMLRNVYETLFLIAMI